MIPPQPRYLEKPPDWTPQERPKLPGSPANLAHSRPIMMLYFVVGLFVTMVGGLGNGIITANLPQFQGEYGLTPSQVAWFPAAYVIGSLSAGILTFKVRQQKGIRWFTEWSLLGFLLAIGLHLVTHSFVMAVVVRAASGFVGGSMSTLGLFYIMQGVSGKNKLRALYFAMAAGQLGVPLAWVLSPHLIAADDWHRLYTFEFGLALCAYALVVMLKLPRGIRIAVFSAGDFVTFVLLTLGFGCLAAVLVQGPIVWWLNDVCLAYGLIVGFGAVLAALAFESLRAVPLVDLRWFSSLGLLRFLFGSFLLRMLMSEQSWAAVNFLRSMGMGSDQFVGLYTVIFCGTLVGGMLSALFFAPTPRRVFSKILLAGAMIALASFMDADLTNQVRPQNFYVSQFLVSCAGGMFIGPLLMIGFIKAMLKSPNHIAMFIILFTASQNFGGLMGSSFYSTYEKRQLQVHRQALLQAMPSDDPAVNLRLLQYQGAYRGVLPDSQLDREQAVMTLNQVVNREATVMAYNDVIRFNSYLAVYGLLWGLVMMVIALRYIKKNPLPVPS